MDEWEDLLFQASYGGVPFDCLSTDDDASRVLVEHEYPFRDGAVLQDMGRSPRRTTCQIIFIPTEDQEINHLDRMLAFVAFLDSANTLSTIPNLLHPLLGSFPALPGPIRFSAQGATRDTITMSVEFVESGLDAAAFTTTDDQSVGSGVAQTETASDDVDAAADGADPELAEELEAQPLTINTEAVATSKSWENNPDLTPRQINHELNAITNTITDETLRLQVAADVRRYPMFLSLQRLHAAIRFSAELAIATGPRLFEYAVQRTEPLLAIVAAVYGGTEALDRYERALELNDIVNPASVPAGTSLTLEQR